MPLAKLGAATACTPLAKLEKGTIFRAGVGQWVLLVQIRTLTPH